MKTVGTVKNAPAPSLFELPSRDLPDIGPGFPLVHFPDATMPPRLRPRLAWIDNLRVALIVGVIAAHVATAYIIDFDWYYMERGPSQSAR